MLRFASRKRNWSSLPLILMLLVVAAGCTHQAPATVKRTYSFWPAAPDEPRVQFLVAYNSSADIQPPQSKFDEMLYGAANIKPFSKPYGVAMWQGSIYLCDVRSAGVTVLDLRKHQTRMVGLGGTTPITKAQDIAISPDGYKFVVDGGHQGIAVLDPDDKLVTTLAPKGLNPVSVAVYQNELFVADFAGKTIKVMDRATGRVLRTIGEPAGEAGVGDGQFWWPLTVRVDPEGNVVVSDLFTCRIQKFSRDGKFLFRFAEQGKRAGDLNKPKHFSFDKNGYMYIADSAFNNVQVFDREGKVVDFFGTRGTHPGAMDIPAGVYVDERATDLEAFGQYIHPAFQAERLVIVTNQFGNSRVAVYAQGRLKPGKTQADVIAARAPVASATQPTTGPDLVPDIDISGVPAGVPATAPAPAPASKPAAP